MAGKLVAIALLALLGACSGVQDFTTIAPPPGDYDRPAIVRGAARAGTYVGATVGIFATIVLWLPVKGLTMAVDEPLGYSEKEWPFLPLTTCAAAGHYVLGLPAEGLYWLFYGAWVEPPEPKGFDHVPGAGRSK
jgi:nitroreductase